MFGLPTLPGLAARDSALVANGAPAMGNLTTALDLGPSGSSAGLPLPVNSQWMLALAALVLVVAGCIAGMRRSS